MEPLAPVPRGTDAQIRTISAWGKKKQADLARLRVGIVGAGSVGAFIAEGMARTGLEDITVIDFDGIETKNLDRLLYAKPGNVGALKAKALAEHLRECATAARFGCPPRDGRRLRGRRIPCRTRL
jgi:tRNA A37 threonylcarbamoyladenosine dehydratase